jgi:hypothetical protein
LPARDQPFKAPKPTQQSAQEAIYAEHLRKAKSIDFSDMVALQAIYNAGYLPRVAN